MVGLEPEAITCEDCMNNVTIDMHTTARLPKIYGMGLAPKGLRKAIELAATSDDPELHDAATTAPNWAPRVDKRYLTMTNVEHGALMTIVVRLLDGDLEDSDRVNLLAAHSALLGAKVGGPPGGSDVEESFRPRKR